MRYELLDSNRGKKTIAMLELRLKDLRATNENTEELSAFQDSLNIIKVFQLNNPNKQLNAILKNRKIRLDQAIFCILGLNPMAVITLDKNIQEKDVLLLDKLLLSNESRMLSMLIEPEKEFTGNSSAEILCEIRVFLNKAIDQGLLKISNNQNSSIKKSTKRLATIEKQILVNKLARALKQEYPHMNRSDIARELSEKEEISLSLETIRKDYLDKHPNY
jgi:patatin-like phospholipase/acyl hydrolase